MEKLIESVLNSQNGTCRFEVDGMTFELRVVEDNNIPAGKANRSAIRYLREHISTEVLKEELKFREIQAESRRIVNQWIKAGMVKYVGKGMYRKIEK